ncbi:MAG: DUF6134 family protein [Pseudomonadota bacterium]
MDRRAVLTGSAALAASLAMPAVAAPVAKRTFRIIRDGDDIGRHTLEAYSSVKGFEIAIDIDIAVKFLGITAYVYRLQNREVWKGGEIVSIESSTNDDGSEERARIWRDGNALKIEGSRFTGQAPISAVTTSYYALPFMKRAPWISTQSGDPLEISVAPMPGRANWWGVTGELQTSLGYDTRGEWVACEFDAGGEPAFYENVGESGLIGEMWASA